PLLALRVIRPAAPPRAACYGLKPEPGSGPAGEFTPVPPAIGSGRAEGLLCSACRPSSFPAPALLGRHWHRRRRLFFLSCHLQQQAGLPAIGGGFPPRLCCGSLLRQAALECRHQIEHRRRCDLFWLDREAFHLRLDQLVQRFLVTVPERGGIEAAAAALDD